MFDIKTSVMLRILGSFRPKKHHRRESELISWSCNKELRAREFFTPDGLVNNTLSTYRTPRTVWCCAAKILEHTIYLLLLTFVGERHLVGRVKEVFRDLSQEICLPAHINYKVGYNR